MPKKLRKPLWIALFSACAAQAQNSDLGLLAGISGPRGQTREAGGTTIATGSVTGGFQINYAWQVLQRAADLYIEVPLVVAGRSSGTVVSGPGGVAEAGSSGPDLFFTPGMRLKISPESRVSFYGAAGFGIASFGATSTIVLPAAGTFEEGASVVAGSRRNSAAFGFGGGVDLRLTRLLSFRGEVRDFITRAGLGEVAGRNHGLFQLGIAFHF